MDRIKVLYVEDELSLSRIVTDTLQHQGYSVHLETDGSKVLSAFNYFEPDICVLDIMLPGIDGYSLCRQIRNRFPKLPVIFLTAKTETADLVKGFDSGGTDYIRKPFSIEELIVRIQNQLQLLGEKTRKHEHTEEIGLGQYTLIPSRYELAGPSGIVKLSPRSMDVLLILASNRNQVTDRRELLKLVWGDDSFFNSRTLDVYIRKLRENLVSDASIEIVTLKGKGYLFLTR